MKIGDFIMKKIICLFLILLMMFSFCGCETKEEKAAREAQEYADHMNDVYEKAKQDYDDLKDELDEYNKSLDRLNGYY